jgi:hypothetical protein
MLILAIHETPSLTQERYESSQRRRCGAFDRRWARSRRMSGSKNCRSSFPRIPRIEPTMRRSCPLPGCAAVAGAADARAPAPFSLAAGTASSLRVAGDGSGAIRFRSDLDSRPSLALSLRLGARYCMGNVAGGGQTTADIQGAASPEP